MPRSRSLRRPIRTAVLTVAAWCASVGPAAGQETPRFHRAMDVERVLPQSSAYDILEDRAGFLWFATREGLARWDGYQVRTWKHDPFDEASLPGNVIRRVVQDSAGDIWVHARNYLDLSIGVARLHAPAYDRVTRYGLKYGWPAVTPEGALLIVDTDSVYAFDHVRGTLRSLIPRLSPTPTMAAATTRDGVLWIGTGLGHLEACDLSAGCRAVPWVGVPDGITYERPNVFGTLLEDLDGTVWVGGSTTLARLTPERDGVEPIAGWSEDVGGYVSDLTRDREGALWILGENGVVLADPFRRVYEPYRLETLGEDTRNTAPTRILGDRAGTVWVATVYGLYRHEPRVATFGHLEYDPRDPASPSSGLVVSLLEDRSGALWVGTIDGGLNRLDPVHRRAARFRYDPRDGRTIPSDIVWALTGDASGRVWAGTDGGLAGYDPDTRSFTRHFIDPSGAEVTPIVRNSVPELVAAGDGALWGTCLDHCDDALIRFDPEAMTSEIVPFDGLGYPGYLGAIDEERLFVGSDRGLFTVDLATRTLKRFDELLPDAPDGAVIDGALSYHVGRAGDYWIGANTGLYRFGPDGARHGRYTDADGLPSSTVYGILEDEGGRLWLSTNRGLASLDPRAPVGQQIRVYDHTTGLRNTEFNRNAFARGADGTFYFGGDRGITYFDPEAVRGNPYRPPIAFTALHRSTSEGTRTQLDVGGADVRIAPDDYTFTFEFAALSYRNPHQNRYRVMLEGFDPDWRDLGVQNEATYTSVPPGRYTFRVRASNDDGLWNEEGISVPVVVEPWLWQTTWFRISTALVVIGLIGLAAWYAAQVRYRGELAALRASQALERERTRISRDMHDEVGANLTEIAILSEIAQRSSNGSDATLLEKIANKSRATVDSIGQIIWAINPAYDQGDRFAARLREYAAEQLESMGLDGELRFPGPGSLPSLTAESRRSAFLILKEALTNVSKHADAGRIDVALEIERSHLRLTVRDDGDGFESGEIRTGEGLRNMRARAEDIGGRLSVRSGPGEGTEIRLDAPIASPTTIGPS
ncbi:MAG: histidine kinase [Gemmatimonadetes bacterium]|nr:histidine kinase [Gemmatimonadota bacterium]